MKPNCGVVQMTISSAMRERCVAQIAAADRASSAKSRAETLGLDLSELSLSELQALDPRIHDGVYQVLTAEASAASRTSHGGTAPAEVRKQIARWKEQLA